MEKEPLSLNKHQIAVVRISRLAMAMSEHFTPGHDVEQTPEYLDLQDNYLQAQTDLMYPDLPIRTHSHFFTG